MKILYLAILLTLTSCAQNAKQEKNTTVFSQEELVNKVLKVLEIDESKTDFIVSRVSPLNPKETIIVIPEVVNENEDVFELNSHIFLVDNTTGIITHKFFESSKTNGWVSDAIFIDEIAIDIIAYKLNTSETAFGISVKYRGSSQPNPYGLESLSLFKKDKNSLKKILDNYTINESSGEVNVNVNTCYGNIMRIENELSISDSTTKGYYDILVKRTNTKVTYGKDENDECNPKENNMSIEDIVLKFNDDQYKESTSVLTDDNISFDTQFANTKAKEIPLIDSTNFDSFIDEDDYNNIDAQAFNLEKLYPNYYKEGYNYRAVASYKIELSDNFYSTVITVLKGDNEMESLLINYDLNGEIIDSQVVSYDEIAEGMFRTQSKITDNKLIVHQIAWEQEPIIKQIIYQILDDGIINEIDSRVLNDKLSNLPLITLALDELKLNMLNVKTELVACKTHPDNPDDYIMIIPEIIDEEEDYLELNNHILIINSRSGEVMQKLVMKGLTSDAVILKDIKIDTTQYLVSENKRAIGIRIYRYGTLQANPYENENLELFVKSGNTLNRVLHNFDIMDFGGERVAECEGEFLRSKSILTTLTSKTNGYFDIMVKSTLTETKDFVGKNGDCKSKDSSTTSNSILQFNGKTYVDKPDEISVQELSLLTKEKAIEKFGTPSIATHFNLKNAHGKFREKIIEKFTKKERQSNYVFIDEVTWEKDNNTWVTVWYKVNKDKSIPQEVYVWQKGTEFINE